MSQIFLSPFAMPELDRVVEQLCAPSSLEGVFHRPLHDAPMPSLDVLGEILSRLKIALFPGYFGMSNVRMESMRYHLSANLDSIFRKLAEQIRCGACFACAEYAQECLECERISREKALEFIERLPHIRRLLATDARPPIRATRLRPARRNHFLLPVHPDHDPLPHRARAVPARSADHPAHPVRNGPRHHRHRHPSRRVRRGGVLHRSRHRRGHWGNVRHRQGMPACIRGLRSARCPSPRGPTGCSSRASPAIRSWRTT